MSKKTYCLNVRGRKKEWCFLVEIDPKYINEWREDGLQIDEVVNTISQWYVDLGLPVKLWCAVQDFLKGNKS